MESRFSKYLVLVLCFFVFEACKDKGGIKPWFDSIEKGDKKSVIMDEVKSFRNKEIYLGEEFRSYKDCLIIKGSPTSDKVFQNKYCLCFENDILVYKTGWD